MATNIEAIRNKMQQVEAKQQAYQTTQGQPVNNSSGKTINEMINATYKPNNTSPYVAKVNNAITSTSGGGNGQATTTTTTTNNDIPKVDPTKTYEAGVADATKKLEDRNRSNMETFTTNENARREAEAEAIRAKVRAAIAQGTQAQNKIINDAPAKFVDPMNRASFQGARAGQAIDERMVAMGLGRSGSNITAQTSNNNQTSGNINDLENTKAKVISDAQAAIANLQASGSLQEVQLVQEAAAKSLERLQAQQNLIDGRQNEQAMAIFNNSNNALKTSYDIGANEKQLGMQEQTINNNQSNADRTFNTGVDQWNKNFNQTNTQNDITNKRNVEADALNKTQIMAQLTGNVPAQNLISQMSPEQIAQYEALGNREGGFAAAMAATNDPNQKVIIDAFRTRFLQANPDNAYANTANPYGSVQTLQGRQVESGLQAEAIMNKLNQLKLDSFPEEQQLTIESAKLALQSGREDLAIKIIEKSQLPEKFKMDMRIGEANINQSNSSAYAAVKNADTNEKARGDAATNNNQIRTDTLKEKSMNNIISNLDSLYITKVRDRNTMAEIPTITGNPEAIRKNILGLKLSDDETDSLLLRYNLPIN